MPTSVVPDERDRWCAERAAARWMEFPVRADPRPIVLIEGAARAEDGFATAAAKMAFLTGVIDASGDVPEEVVHLMRRPQVQAQPPRSALRVRGAAPAEAMFATDRGRKRLQAWRVVAGDAHGPIWVLRQEVLNRCWSPPKYADNDIADGACPSALRSAVLGSRGRELTVDFVGGSEALVDYEAEIIEATAAVAVIPRERTTKALGPVTAITAEGHPRQIRAHLREPFGNRVLVNLDGTAVEVSDQAPP